MNLWQAFRLSNRDSVALVGAGGKSSTLFRLAQDCGGPVFLTTTTHMAVDEVDRAATAFEIADEFDLIKILSEGKFTGPVLIYSSAKRAGKIDSICPAALEILREYATEHEIPLLIEADGSRRLGLKAPFAHEPVIPPWVSSVIVVAGLRNLGKPATSDVVYNLESFLELGQGDAGAAVTREQLIRVLADPAGGLQGIPAGAVKNVFLNQRDECSNPADAVLDSWQELICMYDRVVIGCAKPKRASGSCDVNRMEPIAGVVLASGDSSRYGQPKQLLDWFGEPFIVKVAKTALAAGLHPVFVVVGAVKDPIVQALKDLPIEIIENDGWQAGQSSSIRRVLPVLGNHCGGAIFLMSDMPQVDSNTIRQILAEHRSHGLPISAPRAGGKRINPVLFDRVVFPDLAEIRGDQGGRVLFQKYPVGWVDIDDATAGWDVDTPEDYQKLVNSKRDEPQTY
jgi:molybdenum cofactor cytidylyltransferase